MTAEGAPAPNDAGAARIRLLVLAWTHVAYAGLVAVFAWSVYTANEAAKARPVTEGNIGEGIVQDVMVPTFLFFLAVSVVLHLVASGLLLRHRGRRAIKALAILSLLGIPFGTLLGIATLVVLARRDVKEMFGVTPAAARLPSSAG